MLLVLEEFIVFFVRISTCIFDNFVLEKPIVFFVRWFRALFFSQVV